MTVLTSKLAKIVGAENVLTDPSSLEPYSHDSTFVTSAPSVVIRPSNTNEVAQCVRELAKAGISITTRGAGTGLSGGAVSLDGGAVIALGRLTSLAINAPSLYATAGAGVITGELQSAAEAAGLMYPPDPASTDTCTIGGNIATNAGGPRCLKYGVTAEYVLGLTVVLADGQVLRMGGTTRKRASGYRLMQLFVGSEGTLGIVTEAHMRLIPKPRYSATLLASFSSVADAGRAVSSILSAGLLPSACELIDTSSLAFVSDLLPQGVPNDAAAVLIVEGDQSEESAIAADLSGFERQARASGATAVTSEVEKQDRSDLWAARRAIGKRLIERRSNRVAEDIAVPLESIAEMIESIRTIGEATQVEIAVFGHAGDGNLHPSLIFSDRDPDTLRRVGDAAHQIFHRAIELGGTVSAEHGLGAIKREYAEQDSSAEEIDWMRKIKKMFDPNGILNPGKVFPTGPEPDRSFMESLPGWLP